MFTRRHKILATVALAVVLAILLLPGCKKKLVGPTEPETQGVLNENTKLPEENPDLDTVLVVGDTLLFVYKSGSSKPEFSAGDIVVGQTGEGYLRKVVSSTPKGDTLVLDTEHASLTDAIEKGQVDTTFALSPSQQQLSPIREGSIFRGKDGRDYSLNIRSGPPAVYPSIVGDLFEIKIPNVEIEVRDPGNNLAVSITIDTLVLRKSIDVDFKLRIGGGGITEFKLVGNSTDEVDFIGLTMDLEQSIVSDAQIKLLTQGLGKIVIWIGPVPVVFVFELGVYAGVGADLTINVSTEIANEVSVSSSNTIGAQYKNGSWEPVRENSLDGNADFNFNPSASLSASLTDYLKGSLDTKLYGVLGPSLYLKPYQYNKVSYPPLDYELGVGIAAGLAFKVEVFSWTLTEFNHTFADYRKSLIHSTEGPDPPTLYSPANGATINDNTPTFDWSEPAGGVGYRIQVDDNNSFGSPAIDQYPGASTYTPSSPLADDMYYWRVRAKNASDVWGAWSVVWNVTIETDGGEDFPNQVVATIPVGYWPWGVAALPNGNYVYVANHYDNKVSVIRTSDHTVVNTVVLPFGCEPEGLTATPDGNYIYVAVSNASTQYPGDWNVSVIRTFDNTVIDTIVLEGSPASVAALPNENYIYVAASIITHLYVRPVVYVIHTLDNTVVDTIWPPVTDSSYARSLGIAALPSGESVYVVDWENKASVIRTSDNTVVATIPVGDHPWGVAALPNGNYVYVANHYDNKVSVIRTSDNTVVATIPVGDHPWDVAALPNGNYVYVTNEGSDNVSVIRTSDNTVVATIPVGNGACGVAALPNGAYVYVTNWNDDNVSVIGF